MPPDFWRGIFDAIDDPVFLHNPQFRILLANRAYCKAAGVTEKEAQGKPYWKVFPLGPGPMPGCKSAMSGKDNSCSREELCADGKYYLSRGYIVYDDQCNILYSLHALRDISTQKENETALADIDARLHSTIDTARDAIISLDSESGLITAWNPAATAMFGYSHEETIGQVLHELLAPIRFRVDATQALAHFSSTGKGNALG